MATAGSDGPDFPVRVECTASALVTHIIPVRPGSSLHCRMFVGFAQPCEHFSAGGRHRRFGGIAVRKFDRLRFRRVLSWAAGRTLAGSSCRPRSRFHSKSAKGHEGAPAYRRLVRSTRGGHNRPRLYSQYGSADGLRSKWPRPCCRTATTSALINLLPQSVPIGNICAVRCLELPQDRPRNRADEFAILVLPSRHGEFQQQGGTVSG